MKPDYVALNADYLAAVDAVAAAVKAEAEANRLLVRLGEPEAAAVLAGIRGERRYTRPFRLTPIDSPDKAEEAEKVATLPQKTRARSVADSFVTADQEVIVFGRGTCRYFMKVPYDAELSACRIREHLAKLIDFEREDAAKEEREACALRAEEAAMDPRNSSRQIADATRMLGSKPLM